jgi:carbonic anhydrase
MQTFSNAEFKAETGRKPHRASLAFTNVDDDLRKSIAKVKACPFLNHTRQVRGFVFDVGTGSLREVQ